MITRKNHLVKQDVGLDTTTTTKRPPTVDEFLRINPLPEQLRHLEPSLRKMPNPMMIVEIMLGCLAAEMSAVDTERIIDSVADMFSQAQQRCTSCLHWTPRFHAIVAGRGNRYTAVPLCDTCVTKFEAGRATPQMQRNMDTYIGEVSE